MYNSIEIKTQDSLAPFIHDDDFFLLNPNIDLRIREWRDEDENRVTGSPGSTAECFWVVGAWRDGTLSFTQFPFRHGMTLRQRKAWYKRFVRSFYAWILLITTSPYARKGFQ